MPMGDYGAYQAPAKKKVIKKRPEDMGRGKKVTVVKKTVSKKVAPPMRKAIRGFAGSSPDKMEYGKLNADGKTITNGKFVVQRIREKDTVLRGRPKPAYKTK